MLEQDIEHSQGVGELLHNGPKWWQRFYMGYQERFVQDCILELRAGSIKVHLAQAPSAKCSAKSLGVKMDKASDPALTGTTVWDGAVVLAQYLTSTTALQGHAYPSGQVLPHCIELGAGTGAVSLALSACRQVSSATITDLADLLPHLCHNVERNSPLLQRNKISVQALRWGPQGQEDIRKLQPIPPPYDLIVGSDLIYYTYSEQTPHSKLLLWTLQQLAAPTTLIFLALSLHHNPEEVEHFLGLAEEHFEVTRIHTEIPEDYRVPDVLVVRMQLRPPSPATNFTVEESDTDGA